MIRETKPEKFIRLGAYGMGPYAMKEIKICPKCGQVVGARKLFCPDCKTWLPVKTLLDTYKKMHTHCPHCSTALTQDARYCPCCGQKVKQSKSK